MEGGDNAEGGDDAEGIELSSRPPSPHTEYEPSATEEDADAVWESPQPLSTKRHRELEPSSPDAPGLSSGGKRSRSEEGDSNTAPRMSKEDRDKLSSKKRRSKKRIARAQSEHPVTSYAAKPSVVERLPALPPLATNMDARKLPKSQEGSWVGKRVTHGRDTPWTLDELRQQGFQVVEWDGWWVTAQPLYQLFSDPPRSTSRKILDRKQRVIVALVGRPSDPTWDQAVYDAAAVMTEVQEAGLEEDCFPDKFLSHRRGEFVAFPVGVSFGGGQKVRLHLKPPGACA